MYTVKLNGLFVRVKDKSKPPVFSFDQSSAIRLPMDQAKAIRDDCLEYGRAALVRVA